MPLEREWVTITDPEDDHVRYTFDVSFLLSNYRCIYGDGCQGVASDGPDEALGCCEHGAYLTEDESPQDYEQHLAELDPATMQYHATALKKGAFVVDDEGETHTRIVKGACIFLNRAGFEGGAGCALHQRSLRRGERPMDGKPVVCWQVPIHRDIDELTANDGRTLEVHRIAAFERGTWGDGGADFHWWCTEQPEAFTAAQPLYRSMQDELREMVGDDVYDELADHLESRRRQHNVVPFLPVV
ncbi:MAG TPA: hypothetical protein VGA69_00195 [Nitriliruptorales bacterium]